MGKGYNERKAIKVIQKFTERMQEKSIPPKRWMHQFKLLEHQLLQEYSETTRINYKPQIIKYIVFANKVAHTPTHPTDYPSQESQKRGD